MEEIGFRSAVFEFEGMAGYQATTSPGCSAPARPRASLSATWSRTAAVDLLARRLRTPLQIEQHLTLAFEEAFRIGEKAVTRQSWRGCCRVSWMIWSRG